MEWTIALNKEKEYCEVVTRGCADQQGSLNMAKAVSQTLKAEQLTKVLIDHSNIRSVSGGIIEVYDRPNKLQEMGAMPIIRIAEVVRTEHREFFDFLKAVCVSRGFLFSVFDNKESAVKWLSE